jgi:IclR family mhp operon transcriptional activator
VREAKASYKPVNAVLRSLEVLAAVNRLRGQATVGELHRETALDKATIVRMLETLMAAGYVCRDDEVARYEVTGKTLLLSAGYDRHRAVGRLVAPLLARFRNDIGWPSDLAIFDRDAMLVVETSREAGPLLVNRHPGYRAPILATSLGLAYLAFTGPEERAAVLACEAGEAAPWNELFRDPRRAKAAFARVRARGYATMHDDYSRLEYRHQISAVGVPVLAEGRAIAAMNVLFLKSVLPAAAAATSLVPALQAAAAEIAGVLAATAD